MALVLARLRGGERAPFRTGVRFTAYGCAGSQLTPSGADPFFPRINSIGLSSCNSRGAYAAGQELFTF
jgi:hypothetical protein